MNEYPPYTQDTSWRANGRVRSQSMSYLRIPSYMMMDEPGRGAYPIVSPTFNDRRFKFEWSEATLRDLEAKIVRSARLDQRAREENECRRGRAVADDRGLERGLRRRRRYSHRPPPELDGQDRDAAHSTMRRCGRCARTPTGGRCTMPSSSVLNAFGEPIPPAVRGGRAGRRVRASLYLGRQPRGVLRRRLDGRPKRGRSPMLGHRRRDVARRGRSTVKPPRGVA